MSSESQVAYCGGQSQGFLIWKPKFYYRTAHSAEAPTTK
ncbi:hypothetical protein [Arthrobacter sp. DR-2P]|nr:hypothetical protein [Arthrobacter sp. DR-2P]